MPRNFYANLKCLDIFSFFDQMTSTDNYFLDFFNNTTDFWIFRLENHFLDSFLTFQEEGFLEMF